ncbi:MAG: 4-hydroxybenzoate octaprenyltransferase [Nitrospirae bacterium]|jgi:4-hydroxybenzoate polyprenyltransferase|nr:4-hydroxybenzoate octaprenyltransferase [Nitrospirota bacterium]MBS1126151.1 4-hydroxybenzoate octaprenyltransferase [Nitrospirota bacterium]MBS1234712.1 4-hydroxybenzoate octaprenyltransferase [Nitrospirota bacterium]
MHIALDKVSVYLRMIKFSHSIFALPFAFTSAIIAASGIPDLRKIVLIVIAMVGARSGAMGLNRVIDREIDSANPRTEGREIPRGDISVFAAALLVIVSFVILVLAAYMLNPLCLKLSPVAIVVLIIYSYTKRFTWMSHFVLGLSISAAPLGAWMAVKGSFDIDIIPMVIAVIFWLAGFDVLYALQDIDFDKKYGLYSIPKRFGIKKSIYFSRIFHITSFLLLLANGMIFRLHGLYWTGMFLVAGLFLYEHSLIQEDDLSKLDIAFFNMNGYISVTVFIFTLMDFVL